MEVKKIIRPLHLIFGLIIGVIVIVVSLTGALYAFEEEFRGLIYKDRLVISEDYYWKESLSSLADLAKKEYPKGKLKNIRFKSDRESSLEFIFKDKQTVCVNQYTARILGTFNKETDFFGFVLKMHRTLFLGDTGKIITGTSATCFVFMLITGIILWWPRKQTPFKQRLAISRNVGWKRLNYDLHSVLGFYASWILIFTALTGMIWSFKWAENSMYWLAGSKKDTSKFYSTYQANAAGQPIDDIFTKTRSANPNSDLFITLPDDSLGPIRVMVRHEDSGILRKQDQLFFDQYSGELLNSKLYANLSAGDKIKAAQYYIHTGKALGLLGQLLVFFAALITASLPVTGFLLWRGRTKIR